jgi:uridine kinase
MVAIDGASGSGKSTIGAQLALAVEAALIPFDDFYSAHVPDAEWDRRTPEQRAVECMDWRRARTEVLEPLRSGQSAQWRAFDFEAGASPDGTYQLYQDYKSRAPSAMVILEGSYSAQPALSDLIDLTILIDTETDIRAARLRLREDSDFLRAWNARWDAAENYYLTCVRPKSSFGIVVTTL